MNNDIYQAIKYVHNTDGNVTATAFDDDHDPIGPLLREEIMPTYVVELPDGRLALTDAGRAALIVVRSQ